jgi:hypothetical protein
MWWAMLGCAASLAGTVSAQDCQPQITGSLGGSAYDVSVVGSTAYVADGSGLSVVDVSDPANPGVLGFVSLGGGMHVAASSGFAYVSHTVGGWDFPYSSVFHVINVSDPTMPTTVGSLGSVGNVQGVAVSGDVAYLTFAYFDLWSFSIRGYLLVVDVSDPVSPTVLGWIWMGPCYDIAVSDGVAYLAVGGVEPVYDIAHPGLVLVAVSDPAKPTILSFIETPGASVNSVKGVAVDGDVAYVAGDFSLQVIDVSDALEPVILGAADMGEGNSVVVSGAVAYVASSGAGLDVLDVIDASSPTILGSVDSPGSARGVAVSGGVAYVADSQNGLQVIDVSSCQPCIGDSNADGAVDVDDLLTVALHLGSDGSLGGDIDGSGTVDVDDLLAVILAWGPCE